jgi:alanine racemase
MSYITLDKAHFFHNLDLIKTQVSHKEKIAIVLKDNAYGHGLIEMAQLAKSYGILHAVVRNAREAQSISHYFQTILILADDLSLSAPDNAYLAVNDLSILSQLSPNTAVELKVDSGMHRSGISAQELKQAFELIVKGQLQLKGVFTHHRSADLLSSEYFWQEKNFQAIKATTKELLKQYNLPEIRFHSQNSAATFRTKGAGDIVRVGIAAYGLLQMSAPLLQQPFKPVLSLWAHKIHTAQSHKHFKHGYEGKGRVSEPTHVTTYDVGYADGLLRLTDDAHYTLPNSAQFIGRVSMDNVIINDESDEICIYNDANSYAKAASTISYEVTTRLSSHIKRTIIS